MLKKSIYLLLLTIFVFSFSGCGGDDSESSSQSLDWPSQYMSTLPEPDSLISNVQRYNFDDALEESDTTTQPTSVNVTMNEMSKKEAQAYYETLKASGFEITNDENEDGKILLTGILNDADKNPFIFSYLEDDHYGNVSITFVKTVYAN